MIKEIKYAGYTAQPADYSSPDGDLALSMNLIPENGALLPILPPSEVLSLSEVQSVVYIHKGSDYVNYIIKTTTNSQTTLTLRNSSVPILTLQNSETIVDIQAIGNILVVSTSLHLYYIYYKNSAYTLLDTELPKVNMQFSLFGDLVSCEHTTKLTFSDFASAEGSWSLYAKGSFNADLSLSSPGGTNNATKATGIVINFAKDLEANTEYRFIYMARRKTLLNTKKSHLSVVKLSLSNLKILIQVSNLTFSMLMAVSLHTMLLAKSKYQVALKQMSQARLSPTTRKTIMP